MVALVDTSAGVPLRLTCALCGTRSLDVFLSETDRLVCGDCCTAEDLGEAVVEARSIEGRAAESKQSA